MKFFSTNNNQLFVDAKTAILDAFPKDKGLYMPASYVSQYLSSTFNKHESLQNIAFKILHPYFHDIPKHQFEKITKEAFNFDCPLVRLKQDLFVLELWHGPTLAFKDFGARFMSRVMSFYNDQSLGPLTILVATSGDTGGAVASGFYDVPGINVVILYPKGKVSELQELQLCTFGKNIQAISVNGTFDDCQQLVKSAFLDPSLKNKMRLSSANSINISRLLPQMIYYFKSNKEIGPANYIVPSGNFGNISAGVISKLMGLDIQELIAATNQNDTVQAFLNSGIYTVQPTKQSLSNAMDVSDPSNIGRLNYIANSTNQPLDKIISAVSISEQECVSAMKEMYAVYQYTADPHTAIAYACYKRRKKQGKTIILSTAHPAKFKSSVESILETQVHVPERLASLKNKEKRSIAMNVSLDELRNLLVKT